LAPQLRRFERQSYTIAINDVSHLLTSLNPRKMQHLSIQAVATKIVEDLFRASSFPNLISLAISEDEPRDGQPPEEVPSIRPLLSLIASQTGRLEFFEVSLSLLKDEHGSKIGAIKEVVQANQETLRILNFNSNSDNRGRNYFTTSSNALQMLSATFGVTVTDCGTWATIADYIKSSFGVHVCRFRILGATIWQCFMAFQIVELTRMPRLERAQALFRAVYSDPESSPIARIRSFEIYLILTTRSNLNFYTTEALKLSKEYLDWIRSEIESNVSSIDLRSIAFPEIALGLLGYSTFYQSVYAPSDEVWPFLHAFSSVYNQESPLVPFLQALTGSLSFHGSLPTYATAHAVLKQPHVRKIDLFAPIGPVDEPLVIYMRDSWPGPFLFLLEQKDMIDLLQPHPTLRLPMLLYLILQPGRIYRHLDRSFSDNLEILLNLYDKNSKALKNVQYTPGTDHLFQTLRSLNVQEAHDVFKRLLVCFPYLDELDNELAYHLFSESAISVADWNDVFRAYELRLQSLGITNTFAENMRILLSTDEELQLMRAKARPTFIQAFEKFFDPSRPPGTDLRNGNKKKTKSKKASKRGENNAKKQQQKNSKTRM
jgi:hypothetical protein